MTFCGIGQLQRTDVPESMTLRGPGTVTPGFYTEIGVSRLGEDLHLEIALEIFLKNQVVLGHIRILGSKGRELIKLYHRIKKSKRVLVIHGDLEESGGGFHLGATSRGDRFSRGSKKEVL